MHPLRGSLRLYLSPMGWQTAGLLRTLERTQWLEQDKLRQLQWTRLSRLLWHAYTHVAYYRTLWDDRGLSPRGIQSFEDFQKIPPLTKADLRFSVHGLKPRSRVRPVDVQRKVAESAARLRAHGWFGLGPAAREIVLGRAPARVADPACYRALHEWLANSKYLPMLDAEDETLERCVEVINRHRPEKIYGYPSVLNLLAGHLHQRRQRPAPGLAAVFTTREPLFDFQRRRLESAFGCPVSMEYSSSTTGLVANECPEGSLHIFQEGIYAEIINPDHAGRGELVVSNLDSFMFPIIRFRTGDIASLKQSPCACGRALPHLIVVDSQQAGFIVTPRGSVHRASAVIKVFGEAPGIREFKVIQEAVDHVVAQVVPQDRVPAIDHATLIGRLRLLLGNDVRVDVVLVPTISRDPLGRFSYIESRAVAPAKAGATAGLTS